MHENANQFELLTQRRFGPFFVTQALGALNDNIFKNALIILIAFRGAREMGLDSNLLVNLAAMIFILPFFLFSATSGQFAEKFEKSVSIRRIKLLEIGVMGLAALGFWLDNFYLLFGVLFLMGIQSTLFGPLKYSILPQHLRPRELLGGNGMVEMGTFVAILIGTMLGGILIGIPESGGLWVSISVLVVAVLGYLFSLGIPAAPPADPGLKINWNPATETWRIFRFMRGNRTVLLSVLGISWFWFYGATLLAQIPNYAQYTLGGDESVVTALLTVFSLGIGIGSILCEKLSGQRIEIGLVPFGAIGLTVFAVDLYFVFPYSISLTLSGLSEFLHSWPHWHVLIDAMLIGVFGGFYIVPLYALVQERCEPTHLSRVIAGNNILNALFMVLSAIIAIILLSSGLNIPQLFLVTGILNAVVAIYIFSLVPEFLMRFLVWLLINTVYRIRDQNLHHIPETGPCVLVANHVSFVDPLIIGGSCRRPVRFVMYHKIYNIPLLNFIFRTARAIPIAPAHEDEALMNQAFGEISAALDQGEVVCIFPEGKITYDGELNEFRPGIERILEQNPVPVVPIGLQGLWDSLFSRKKRGKWLHRLQRLRTRVGIVAGAPLSPAMADRQSLQEQVLALRGERR